MRKIFFVFVFLFIADQLFSQPIFTYGNNEVDKNEFLKAYNKNKTPISDTVQSLREYLELYSKFKLKVQAAKELRLDTMQQLKYDLQSFSSQVEDGYLTDEKKVNELIAQAIERNQIDIHVVHFYVPFGVISTPADSLKAIKAMEELQKLLQAGPMNYDAATQKISAGYMPINTADIGFVTALSVPYEIENLIYSLKPGEYSKIYRTKKGLHIFKNKEERPSAGKWKIAQILLALPPNSYPAQAKEVERKADSIYNLLQAGADFATLAKQFSEDRLTSLNGGEMPEFGTGKFDMYFESKVFQLQKDGDISKPIYTDHGYHIVKRLQQHAIPVDMADETYVAAIRQQIEKDPRINIAKENFLKEITPKTGFRRNGNVKNAELFKYADSVVFNKMVKSYPVNNKIIFFFSKGVIKGFDWLNFIKDYKLNNDVYRGEANQVLLDKFTTASITDYYRKHLAEFNNDYKLQIQEFKEGNMLFEIMERNVWGKASNDSAGLKKYYDEHKAKYKWAPSANVLIFNCTDSKVAAEAIEAIKSSKNWKELAEKSDGRIQSDSGRYEIAQLQLADSNNLKLGYITAPAVNSGDNTTGFVKVLQIFPGNQPRTYNEAKGLVINDYQNYLEEKWIASLKNKYPIKVNEAVFQSIINSHSKGR